MAFARPYSQAERELALAKLNATKPQLPVDPMPTPGPGQYNAASLPGILASGPAENPLTGGLDQRMGAMQSQLRSLLAQQQFAQAQQGNNYQSLQSILAQPGPQMDLPQRQYLSPEQMGLNGALQFLAAIGGARPQYIQPIQAQQAQQQQRLDQGFQDEYMRRQIQYNAEAQARQAQERAAMLKVQQGSEELRSIGALIPKAESGLNDLTVQQANMDAKSQAEAGRNARQEKALQVRQQIAAMKDPVAQAKAITEAAMASAADPNSPFYGNPDGAMKFFGAEQLRKAAIAANQQSMAEDRAATRDARVAKLVSAKLVDEARAKEIVAKVAEMPARLADTLSLHAAQIERMRDMSAIGYAGLDLDQARILQKDLENDGKALNDAYYDNIKRIRQLNDYLNDPKNPGNAKDSKAQAEVDDLIKANEAISKYGTATLTEQKKIIRDALEKSKTRSPKAPAPQNGANGNIPASSLKAISGSKLRALPEVADAYDQMVAAAAKDGIRLTATDGYRTLAQQQDVKARKPNLAATPGKSQHGLGRALDINTEGGAGAWLAKNAARFGFTQPPGLAKKEPWHWEYRG